MDAVVTAAPAISHFISSIPALGLIDIPPLLFTLNSKNSHNFKNLKIIFFYLAFTTIALVLNKFLLLEKINLIIYYFFGILMIFSFHVVYNKIYNAN
jgi:hypothetical protein